MKIPNLPAECIRRVLTDEEMTSLKEKLTSSAMYGTILAMINLYGINSYTIEELDKLDVLNDIITTSIYLCNRYELTKEALELFDEVKSNTKALQYFLKMIRILGQNLLKDPGVKQYILDTLIGPEWKEPNFYLYDDNILNLIIDENLRQKKNISSILCDGLCIFDNIPEDRINKFYDALRRLKPFLTRAPFVRDRLIYEVKLSYKFEDFPISISKDVQQDTVMELKWCMNSNYLIILKDFVIKYWKRMTEEKKSFLKRLKEKYPKQMRKVKIVTRVNPLQWKHSRVYNLPDDLRGLTN